MFSSVAPIVLASMFAILIVGARGNEYAEGSSSCSSPTITYPGPSVPPEQTPPPPAIVAKICNPHAETAIRLDIDMTTGGSPPVVIVQSNPPGCETPAISREDGFSFEISWPQPCVHQNESIDLVLGAECHITCGGVWLLCYDWAGGAQSPCHNCTKNQAGCGYWTGHVDCYDGPNLDDVFPLLRHLADLPSLIPESCPQVESGSGASVFADFNCDGLVDPPDLVRLIRHFAYLPDPLMEGCRAIS